MENRVRRCSMPASTGCAVGSFAPTSWNGAASFRPRAFTSGARRAGNSPTTSRGRTAHYSCWRASGRNPNTKGDRRIAFAIVTDEPNELVAPYHDRMPLALADDKVRDWLDLARDEPLREPLLLDVGQ